RLGVDGAFPSLPDIRAGRLQRGGGMHYSTSTGKVCPGDARIAQIPELVAAVATPTPAPVPTPEPDVQEDDMIIIRRKTDGAAFAVSGGRGARVLSGTDLAAAGDAKLPTWNVSDAQYTELANRYLAGA